MEQVNKKHPNSDKKQPVPSTLKVFRALSIMLLVAAIAYIIMPYDFDTKGWLGYIDDFFIFMAAFTFFYGNFLRADRWLIRRQLHMISLLFFIMAMLWVFLLGFII